MNKILLPFFAFLVLSNSIHAQTDVSLDSKIREIILQDVIEKKIDKDPAVLSAMKAAQDAVLFKSWAQTVLQATPVTQALKESIYIEQSNLLGKKEYKVFHFFVVDEKSALMMIEKMKELNDWNGIDPKSMFSADVKYSFSRTDWINASRISSDFRSLVINIGKGEFSKNPIKSNDGWHVVGLIDVRPFVMPEMVKIDKELQSLAERKIIDAHIKKLLSESAPSPKVGASSKVTPVSTSKSKK